MKYKIKNNDGTALLLTLLILTSILVVALGAANLIIPGIRMSRTQEQSTKAFFAAEGGAERALWELRKNFYEAPEIDTENVFSGSLTNNSVYQVDYSSVDFSATFTSTGRYQQTRRSVAVNFTVSEEYGECVPDCTGKLCGDNDGCGGFCPSTCFSLPGCRQIAPANTQVSSGSCCDGVCYACEEDYFWDGAACVPVSFDAATLNGASLFDIKDYIDSRF